jgi:hypothetical protein
MLLKDLVLEGASFLGLEPGAAALSVVGALCGAIAAHADAASGNDATVQEAARRADAARRLVEALAEADVPGECPSVANVVHVLGEVEKRAQAWNAKPKWRRNLAISRTGKSVACKYRESFRVYFALLDRALEELLAAVQVDTFSCLHTIRTQFAQEATDREREFGAAAAGEQTATLAALGRHQDASLVELHTAARAHSDALTKAEAGLLAEVRLLKESLAAGMKAATAAEHAAVAAAGALLEEPSADAAAVDDAATVAVLQASLLEHVVPVLLDALAADGKLTRAAVDAAKREVVGEVLAMKSNLDAVLANQTAATGAADELAREMQDIKRLLRIMDQDNQDKRVPPGTINVEHLEFVTGKAGKLGSGGQGTVRLAWLCLPGAPRTSVAVKTVSKDDPDALAALLNEVKVLRALQHGNVVRLFGVAQHENGDGDEFVYAVLELCLVDLETAVVLFSDHAGNGRAAKAFLASSDRALGMASGLEDSAALEEARRRLGGLLGGAFRRTDSAAVPLAAWRVFDHTSQALCYMHSLGIVHGDLKPANVLIDARGRVKLSDCGMARAVRSSFSRLNSSSLKSGGGGLGTLGFAAPEVVNGEALSKASDVFSLGVTFACVLSGTPVPFAALSPAAVVAAVGNGQRPSLPPSTPASLKALVLRMWHPTAASRPTSARVFADVKDLRAGRTTAIAEETGGEEDEEERSGGGGGGGSGRREEEVAKREAAEEQRQLTAAAQQEQRKRAAAAGHPMGSNQGTHFHGTHTPAMAGLSLGAAEEPKAEVRTLPYRTPPRSLGTHTKTRTQGERTTPERPTLP